MKYEEFLDKAKKTVNVNPYKPFNLDGRFWYKYKNPLKENTNYILQYWEVGGSEGGSCWGSESEEYYLGDKEKPRDFKELYKLLMKICPNLTFLQYKMIKTIIEEGEESDYQYYGNRTDYKYQLINLKKLYDKLVELNVIKNV